jgi:hypothetical protein
MKSRRIKWAGHVVRMGEKRNPYGFWGKIREERDNYENHDVGERTILKWISKK